MSQAINAYYTITASSEFREKEKLRAKARHDEAQALYNARREAKQEEKFEIARNLLKMSIPYDQIAKAIPYTASSLFLIRTFFHSDRYTRCRPCEFVLSDLQGKKEIAATTTNSDGWPFLDGIVCC